MITPHHHPHGPLLSAPATFLGEEDKNHNSNEDTEVKVSIYEKTTPDTCCSIAVGIVHQRAAKTVSSSTNNMESSWPAVLFIKDRNRHESIIQATNYRIGTLISSALSIPPEYVVATSYSIPRPATSELVEGSAAWQLWKRKESIFEEKKSELEVQRNKQAEAKREYNKRTGEEEDDDEGGEGDVEDQRPSNYECWQLEAAAYYLPEEGGTYNDDEDVNVDDRNSAGIGSCISHRTKIDVVDSSLRAKLRRAASRSPTGTLHLWDVLVLAKCCQSEIRNKEKGWEESTNLLVPDRDALTREEVLHLLENKLNNPEIEASVLFCAITAQPDAHHFNLAVREFVRENNDNENPQPSSQSLWGVALVNFDTGTLPVNAGVHLESCEYLYDGHEMNNLAGFEFDGDVKCKGYYYPTLVQLLDENRKLSAQAANGILNLDGSAIRSLVEEEYATLDSQRNMTQLGSIMEERIGIMQKAVREVRDKGGTNIALRELCFRACRAWERDWSKSQLDDVGETLVWMRHWARTGDMGSCS